MKPEIGKTYEVNHLRKGTFVFKVTGIYKDFMDWIIINGTANAILEENVRTKGEEISLRIEFCQLKEINSQQPTANS